MILGGGRENLKKKVSKAILQEKKISKALLQEKRLKVLLRGKKFKDISPPEKNKNSSNFLIGYDREKFMRKKNSGPIFSLPPRSFKEDPLGSVGSRDVWLTVSLSK